MGGGQEFFHIGLTKAEGALASGLEVCTDLSFSGESGFVPTKVSTHQSLDLSTPTPAVPGKLYSSPGYQFLVGC